MDKFPILLLINVGQMFRCYVIYGPTDNVIFPKAGKTLKFGVTSGINAPCVLIKNRDRDGIDQVLLCFRIVIHNEYVVKLYWPESVHTAMSAFFMCVRFRFRSVKDVRPLCRIRYPAFLKPKKKAQPNRQDRGQPLICDYSKLINQKINVSIFMQK